MFIIFLATHYIVLYLSIGVQYFNVKDADILVEKLVNIQHKIIGKKNW